jgi:hypothetical protein
MGSTWSYHQTHSWFACSCFIVSSLSFPWILVLYTSLSCACLSIDEEVALEVTKSHSVPVDISQAFTVEFVWKATSFDRMRDGLKRFASSSACSTYVYHRVLGHDVEPETLKVAIPKKLSVPGLPTLNTSQEEAIAGVLQQPLSLIQGPPGTGKTVTSASLVFHLVQMKVGKILVAAPSNTAVDQLTEQIDKTGVKVCFTCAFWFRVLLILSLARNCLTFTCIIRFFESVRKVENRFLLEWTIFHSMNK